MRNLQDLYARFVLSARYAMSAEVGEEGWRHVGCRYRGIGSLPTGNTEQLCKSRSLPDGDKVAGESQGQRLTS